MTATTTVIFGDSAVINLGKLVPDPLSLYQKGDYSSTLILWAFRPHHEVALEDIQEVLLRYTGRCPDCREHHLKRLQELEEHGIRLSEAGR